MAGASLTMAAVPCMSCRNRQRGGAGKDMVDGCSARSDIVKAMHWVPISSHRPPVCCVAAAGETGSADAEYGRRKVIRSLGCSGVTKFAELDNPILVATPDQPAMSSGAFPLLNIDPYRIEAIG